MFFNFTLGEEDSIYTALENVTHITVYRKADIPAEYRYTYNTRIPPLVIVAENGYSVCVNQTDCDTIRKTFVISINILNVILF